MSDPGQSPREGPDGFPTLTVRGGGWVIVAAAAVLAAFLAWALSGVMTGDRPVGSGSDPAAYGFVLEPLDVPEGTLVGSGNPRNFLSPLDRPATIRGSEVMRWNAEHRRKLVVSADRVAGVVVNGEARAYPLSILNAHEVINDELGGVPIAVTYSPLTDSLVVFDRRDANGAVRAFRVSGLLCNANLVMYDDPAQPEGAEHVPSLWGQLPMRAIAGPAAARGERLRALPDTNICSWRQWLSTWPDTTVAMGDAANASRYKEFSYARYFLTSRIDYPVLGLVDAAPEPQTPDAALAGARRGDGRTRKTAVVEVREGDSREVRSLAELAAAADAGGLATFRVGGRDFEAIVQPAPLAVMVRAADGGPAMVVPQLWFAANARFTRTPEAPGK
ncbi:MAG: hypothetical protein RI990_1335 [Planctomycetota bacterium]|jgi:hypothetical protein